MIGDQTGYIREYASLIFHHTIPFQNLEVLVYHFSKKKYFLKKNIKYKKMIGDRTGYIREDYSYILSQSESNPH